MTSVAGHGASRADPSSRSGEPIGQGVTPSRTRDPWPGRRCAEAAIRMDRRLPPARPSPRRACPVGYRLLGNTRLRAARLPGSGQRIVTSFWRVKNRMPSSPRIGRSPIADCRAPPNDR